METAGLTHVIRLLVCRETTEYALMGLEFRVGAAFSCFSWHLAPAEFDITSCFLVRPIQGCDVPSGGYCQELEYGKAEVKLSCFATELSSTPCIYVCAPTIP